MSRWPQDLFRRAGQVDIRLCGGAPVKARGVVVKRQAGAFPAAQRLPVGVVASPEYLYLGDGFCLLEMQDGAADAVLTAEGTVYHVLAVDCVRLCGKPVYVRARLRREDT